ncbi:unnamed protein product [Echinostoma caproni]|uniref:Uncharacterized protein n=1 Tax=Echinostoma caproni TaxID=27848 RepID=A0A183B8Y7_9TREM|nr:unnamed protein product [Echinostoma caproni]
MSSNQTNRSGWSPTTVWRQPEEETRRIMSAASDTTMSNITSRLEEDPPDLVPELISDYERSNPITETMEMTFSSPMACWYVEYALETLLSYL